MKKFISVPYIISTFVILGLLMISSALYELNQSKKELLEVMSTNAHATLDGAIHGSILNIYSGQLLEDEIAERLFDNARLLERALSHGQLTQGFLSDVVSNNRLLQTVILDENFKVKRFAYNELYMPGIIIPDIVENGFNTEELLYDIIIHSNEDMRLFTAIYERTNGDYIVVSINAESLLEFRKKAGIGRLISEIADNENVVYLAVQDEQGILAAKNVSSLSSISEDSLLAKVLYEDITLTREIVHMGDDILEVIHPFYFEKQIRGIFRMGLSLEPLMLINQRVLRRLLIITTILIILGLLLFTLLNIRQQYDLVNRQYDVVQTHFSQVVNGINEGIITLDADTKIKSINPAAEKIFKLRAKDILQRPFKTIDIFSEIDISTEETEMPVMINEVTRHLSIAVADMPADYSDRSQKIILVHDHTEKRILEDQLRQKEKLTAMGQLASGVAHEVRNPLNAISTIIQQFDLDFEPKENSDEFHSLAKLVVKEVKRINEIITKFVKYARPPKLNVGECDATSLCKETMELAKSSAGKKNIKFISDIQEDLQVKWDCNQIRQCVINLLKNAIEAINGNGEIQLHAHKVNNHVQLSVKDNGQGIVDDHLSKIFNLYFTTKQEGTGFGLSDVHRIVSQHGGNIDVKSDDKGTTFIVNIPRKVK